MLFRSADGNSAYFIGSDTGGVYRLRSAPLQILRSSALLRNSHVQVHPLGNNNALLYATTDDVGTNSRVNLYVILPEQAESGALSLENLSPCASYTVPNQRLAGSNQQALAVITFAAGPAASAAGESTVLVSVLDPFTFSNPLGLRATVAFTVAADATSCAAVGVINLDRSLGLRF